MGAALSGTMRSVIQKAAEHATQRVQFGGRIDGYGAIQEKIARYKLLREILLVGIPIEFNEAFVSLLLIIKDTCKSLNIVHLI